MLKYLSFPGEDPFGNPLVQAIGVSNRGLVKTASAELHPEISSFINNIRPQKDKLYVLVNALGSGEYYGSNVNGDYFEERELLKEGSDVGFNSFLNAGIYRHHKNKEPEKSMGKVKLAVYNPGMRRVELILEVDRSKADSLGHSDLVRQLDEGKHPSVSMGCKVKHDVCSICGHQSKTRMDYCDHAKHMMNRVYPDGRKVFVFNPNPRFFDISFVVIGADKTSYAMSKVAHANTAFLSADAAYYSSLKERDPLSKLAKSKISELLKRIPAIAEKINPTLESEEAIPKRVLTRMSKHPVGDILTSSASSCVLLKPQEYQRIILIKLGKSDLADALDRENLVFAPTSKLDKSISFGKTSQVNTSIIKNLAPFLEKRSFLDPYLSERALTNTGSGGYDVKRSYISNDLLDKISAGYSNYRVELLEKVGSLIERVTSKNTDIINSMAMVKIEDGFLGNGVKHATANRGALLAALGIFPLSYLYGAYVREKRRAGKSVSAIEEAIEKHPLIASSMAVGLTRLGLHLHQKGLPKSPYASSFIPRR